MFKFVTFEEVNVLKKILTFGAVLGLIYLYLGFGHILHLRPLGYHAWAQCDRASVARNYAEESMNFFKPRTNFGKEGDGVIGLEFPLMNYGAAICYKLFGFSEFWYRFLMLAVISAGLIAAFQLCQLFLNSIYLSALLVLLWVGSPVLLNYMPNFIPDTAGLGLSLIFWYCYLQFFKSGKLNILLFAAIMFAALASLVKVTCLINPAAALCIAFLNRNSEDDEFKKGKVVFQKTLLGFCICIASVLLWYLYAAWLNKCAVNPTFTLAIHPITNKEDFDLLIHEIKREWIGVYYPFYIYYLLLISVPVLVYFRKKLDLLLMQITIFLWLGTFAFFLLMDYQFIAHDYYIITLLIAPLFQLLLLFKLCAGFFNIGSLKKHILPLFTLVICVFSYRYAKAELNARYNRSREPADVIFDNFFDAEPQLRRLGITRYDKVILLTDQSMNIGLYFLNVKGWRIRKEAPQSQIDEAANKGARYIVVRDPDFKPDHEHEKYFVNQILEYKGFKVFLIPKVKG